MQLTIVKIFLWTQDPPTLFTLWYLQPRPRPVVTPLYLRTPHRNLCHLCLQYVLRTIKQVITAPQWNRLCRPHPQSLHHSVNLIVASLDVILCPCSIVTTTYDCRETAIFPHTIIQIHPSGRQWKSHHPENVFGDDCFPTIIPHPRHQNIFKA